MTAGALVVRTIAVELTIPDNAALTAFATLERLGVELGGLERADLYRATFEDGFAERALATLRDVERLYNPNKHRWSVRANATPEPGELWVEDVRAHERDREDEPVARVFGRPVEGLARFETFVAWRLRDASGELATAPLLRRAAEALLCNFAFQRTVH